MRNLGLLLGIQWREIIRFQSLESDRRWLQRILIILLLCLGLFYLGGYSYLMATILVPLKLTMMLPGAILAVLSFLFLIMNMFKADAILIHPKDDAILCPLPLSRSVILASRLLVLYLFELITSLAVMGICLTGIALVDPLPITTTLTILVSTPLIPLLPFTLGLALGMLMQWVSGYFQHTHLIKLCLMFALIAGLFFLSTQLSNEQELTHLVSAMTALLNQIYPLCGAWLAFWTQLDGRSLLLITVFSLASVCMTMILAVYLAPLIKAQEPQRKTNANAANHNRSLLSSLYDVELKRYWNSQIYVINTAIGPLLMLGGVIYLCFQDLTPLMSLLTKEQLTGLAWVILSLIIGLSTTTHVAISLEGEWFWIKKSLPIPATTLFLGKLLVNWTLTVPTTLLCLILLSIPLDLNLMQWSLLALGSCISCFCFPLLGIYVNLTFPKCQYTSEMIVVKQSLASLIMVGIDFALSLLPLGLMYLFSDDTLAFMLGIGLQLLLGIMTGIYLQKRGEQRLLTIH